MSILREEEPQRKPFTMFRVPADVRASNRTAYEPRMVSIGPYYHGSAALRTMEDHKWRYLLSLLSRNAAISASTLVEAVRSLEPRARACYSERPELDADAFVRMLLLDGCFILEFLFKWHQNEPDELCDVGWGLTLVDTDLLLLENQIPFFVVERIYDLVAGSHGGSRENLVRLIRVYNGVGDDDQVASSSPAASVTGDIHHLLHLYYESFVPKLSPTPTNKETKKARAEVIPRATEMSAAGVTFVRRASARDVYDVTFDRRRGVMEIPGVEVDDMRRPLLINLIKFEQTRCREEEEAGVVTSYVSLMGMLVRTAQDVELLRRRGVLDNLMADDDEAARFFSHLGDGGSINYGARHVYSDLYDDVQRYCGSWWHTNQAALRRDYFGSPWSAISFIVAAVVVALTATQTFFTVFPRNQ